MDLRYAYKYEENKREIKIGEEKKYVNERSVPVIPGLFRLLGPFRSIPVFKRTGKYRVFMGLLEEVTLTT